MAQSKQVELQIECADLNESSLQSVTRDLAKDLRHQNVETVTLPEALGKPGKKGDPVTVGTIIMTMLGSQGMAVALVHVLQAYVARKSTIKVIVSRRDGTSVKIEAANLDENRIHATIEDLKKLLES